MRGCAIEHVRYFARFTEQLDPHPLSDTVSLPASFTAGLPTFLCVMTPLSSRGDRSEYLEFCWRPLGINFHFVSVKKIIVPVTTGRRVLRLRMEERPPIWRVAANTGLFIRPSGISELDCATTMTNTAERSISIGTESLQVFFCTRGLGVLPPLGGSRDEKWRSQ